MEKSGVRSGGARRRVEVILDVRERSLRVPATLDDRSTPERRRKAPASAVKVEEPPSAGEKRGRGGPLSGADNRAKNCGGVADRSRALGPTGLPSELVPEHSWVPLPGESIAYAFWQVAEPPYRQQGNCKHRACDDAGDDESPVYAGLPDRP